MDHPKNHLAKRISLNIEKFTPTDHRVADYILREYPTSMLQNASEIARALQINVSTVTRFFPKIGYQSIKDAMTDFKKNIQFLINSPLDRYLQYHEEPTTNQNVFNKIIELDVSNIQNTFKELSEKAVNLFVELITNKSRSIYVLGTRKEFSVAFYFYYQMASFRDNIFLLNPSNLIDQLSRVKSRDLLIIFDFRRYSGIHRKASRFIKEIGGEVIVFADSPIAPSAAYSDCLLVVKTTGLSAFDSYTAALALNNALLALLIEHLGEQFREKSKRFEDLYKRFEVFVFQK